MNLTLNNLSKSFDSSHVILKNVSLQVRDVHVLVFIGPSGGGKTTLLRMLAGLSAPDSGDIVINNTKIPYQHDIPVSHSEALRRYRLQVGTVFQAYNLFPHFSALENITFPLQKAHNINQKEATETAMQLLERFQLANHAHKHPHQLSGGQKQRISISRSLAINPEVILLDEPTSALDPEFTVEVLDMLVELRGTTDIVLVTHHMGFAREIGDHIFFVGDGSIIEHASAEEIFTSPKDERVQSFFSYILKHNR